MSEAQQHAQDAITTAGERDLRIKRYVLAPRRNWASKLTVIRKCSFYSFLNSIGEVNMARNEILKDTYALTFERGIDVRNQLFSQPNTIKY